MALHRVKAFFLKDVIEEMSYPLAQIWRLGSIIFRLVTFYFVGKLMADSVSPFLVRYGGNYFSFVILGLALDSFLTVSLTSTSNKILYGMYSGTLEAILVTPTRLSTIVFSSVLYSFSFALLEMLLYFGLGVALFGLSLGRVNFVTAAIFLLLALLTHLPLGIMGAGFILIFKRGDPITAMFGPLSTLLGGGLFPVAIFPGWLQSLSFLIPFTHALEGLRQAVLNGRGLAELKMEAAVLCLLAAVMLPASLAFFRWAVVQTKKLGTLSQY